MRLAKYLAHGGVASRRSAEKLVTASRVTVDGKVVLDPAFGIEGQDVAVDGKPVKPEVHEVHMLNKPLDVVSTAKDTHGRRTVVDLIESDSRLYPVGRLDADTTGLILLTNDGALADRLTHPRYGVQKTYHATVTPPAVSQRALRELREGVRLEEGMTSPARVRSLGPGELELRIGEGRKRQVRRMCEAVGHEVTALERVQFGPLRLSGLPEGEARRLTPHEVERLRKAGDWENPRP